MSKVIILFSGIFDTGGIQRYNRYLCSALDAEFREHTFAGISLCDAGKNRSLQWRNLKIKYCGKIRLSFVKKAVFFLNALSECISGRPEFLVCCHADLSPAALLFKTIFRLRYAVLTHSVDVWNLRYGIKYEGLKNADIITAVSQYTKKRLIENGINENKIVLLHDAVDTSIFVQREKNKKLLQKWGIYEKIILLTVSRMDAAERYKGHDIMLKVMQDLGDKYVWLVIGAGNDVPRLFKKAKEKKTGRRIIFCGLIPDDELVDYYNLCDLFIMPSSKEGFGIVYLEAMACGKPVVAGNKDGSADPLINGRLGFLVNPDSVDEIVNAVRRACTFKENRTDPEFLKKEVKRHFDIQVFNRRVKEVFNKEFS
ncbi:MAG: glycosyltransferase family 4 protein [Candidatus Omnitrophica bacterium]|nr:glycosyltransferase family 4 protein [Candidatus Omnitrophota bacterium]